MRWIKPSLTSIYSLLGKPPPVSEPADAFRVEAVRQMMMDAMSSTGLDKSHPQVFRRISFALDIHTLWYARSDLMTVLASARGETFAHEKIGTISALFEGLLPQTLRYDRRAGSPRIDGKLPRHGPKRR